MNARGPVGLLLAAFLLVSLGSACAAPTTSREPTVLRVALPTFGAEVMDPSVDGLQGLWYHGHLFDPLVGTAVDGTLDPDMGLLERWEVNADATEYTLTLRPGTLWHDGVEVTAADIAFSLDHYPRRIATCTGCSSIESALQRVEVLDKYTARLHLNRPDAEFLYNLASVQGDMPLLPRHHWLKVGAEGFERQPVGAGPWKFLRRVKGQFIEFEANRDYWDPDRVPAFDRLRLILVPDPAERLARLRAGQVDMTIIPVDQVIPLKAEGFHVQGPRYVIDTTLRFFMSYDPAYLNAKLSFRKALALALDTPSIIREVYPPEAASVAPAAPFASPASPGWDPSLQPHPYDPAAARALLREAGYKGETVYLMSIVAYGLQEVPRINDRIKAYWEAIGLKVEVYPTDYPPIKARYAARPQDFADVAPAPVFHGAHENRPGFLSSVWRYMTNQPDTVQSYHDLAKGDRLYDELSAIADTDARNQRINQLFHEWEQEFWAIPVVWRHDTYALRPGLTGWQPTGGSSYDLHLETVRPSQ